jgi:hypothetical protein
MVAVATDLTFADGRKTRLREREHSDPISLHPGLSSHRLLINLESETIAGVDAETYPLVVLAGEVHCINVRQIDRLVGPLAPASLILRPDSIASMVHDLAVTLDDAAVLALDEAVEGQDFQLRLDLRAHLTGVSTWPEASIQMLVPVPYSIWARHLVTLHRTVTFTGSIPIPTIAGPLAEVGRHLHAAEQQLLSGHWTDAVRLIRLAQEVMKKTQALPKPNFTKLLDQRTLGEKYGNAMWTIFELASVPQHAGVAQQEPLGRADAYAQFWMTAAMYYKLVDAAQP